MTEPSEQSGPPAEAHTIKHQSARSSAIWKAPLFHGLLIAVLVCLAYSNTLHAPFTFDDTSNISENPAIRDLSFFSDISKIDTAQIPPSPKVMFRTRYLGYLTFALNYRFGGLNVVGYHIVNILIHITSSLLVYWLVLLTFRTRYCSAGASNGPKGAGMIHADPGRFIALFAALLFASHPIQTQAITYIVQRFASFATLLYLLAFTLYVRWRLMIQQKGLQEESRQGSSTGGSLSPWFYYGASFFSALLAMKTKELVATLPLVMLLYEFMFFSGKTRKRLLYLLPFALLVLLIPLSLIGSGSSPEAIYDTALKTSMSDDGVSRTDYLLTQLRVIVTYIRLLLLPIHQTLDYDYPIYRSFLDPAVFLSFLVVVSLLAFAVYLARSSRLPDPASGFTSNTSLPLPPSSRLIAFGVLWFLIALSAESGVIPIKDVIFEHRVYLPSVGFLIALTAAIQLTASRRKSASSVAFPILVVIVLALTSATYARNRIWKDDFSLWNNTVLRSPEKARPHYNLGNSYAQRHRYDEAIEHYIKTTLLKPDHLKAHYNLAVIYERKGLIKEALRKYDDVLQVKPDFVNALYNQGGILLRLGRYDAAEKNFREVLKISPKYAKAHNALGNTYRMRNDLDQAITEYLAAIGTKPDYFVAHYNLASAYLETGRVNEAIAAFRSAIRIKPDIAGPHKGLGNAYLKQNRKEEAAREFETFSRLTRNGAAAGRHRGTGVQAPAEFRIPDPRLEVDSDDRSPWPVDGPR